MTVAFWLDFAWTSGAMLLASGPDEAPELDTAWQGPVVFAHDPAEWLLRGSGDTEGLAAVTADLTLPVQVAAPSQFAAAPDTDAADGPAASRAALAGWSPAKFCAAPGPVEAAEADWIWQVPPPAWQEAVPFEVRGLPPSTAPSHAAELVVAVPEQMPVWQSTPAVEDDVADGPAVGWPFTGCPLAGSVCTKSGAEEPADVVSPEQPPTLTVQSAEEDEPRRCGNTPVSSAEVALEALPPQLALSEHCTRAPAFDTLTGLDTDPVTGLRSTPSSASRSATSVLPLDPQPPPAPCASHDDASLLSRAPLTSPDASPVVALSAVPLHCADAQSIVALASLFVVSAGPVLMVWSAVALNEPRRVSARSPALVVEVALDWHPPSVAVQSEAPVVVRVVGLTCAAVAVIDALVEFAPLPVQTAFWQSMRAWVLAPSASVPPEMASQPPSETWQVAMPECTRSVVLAFAEVAARFPVAGSAAVAGVPGVVEEPWELPAVVDAAFPEQPVAAFAQCAAASALGEPAGAPERRSSPNQLRSPPSARVRRTTEEVSQPPALAWQCAELDASPVLLALPVLALTAVVDPLRRRPELEVSQPPSELWQSELASD